eukprot:TRINITY_DN35087_c0_g1_i5.p1 TRINITY_DN35087_c0_g1~~TRINITY_DN35087_c0_g1_i5.p1  ORF type:complete len:193 (-),score=15.50 TRINITY_DN35087_c0_g1_i5:49-627(-)
MQANTLRKTTVSVPTCTSYSVVSKHFVNTTSNKPKKVVRSRKCSSLVVKSILADSSITMTSPTTLSSWQKLTAHKEQIENTHLKELLIDEARSDALQKEHNGVLIDFSRQRVTRETVDLLTGLAEECQLKDKIESMYSGARINSTEDRSVLHVATRARRDQKIVVDGEDVVPKVWEVLDKIKSFSVIRSLNP